MNTMQPEIQDVSTYKRRLKLLQYVGQKVWYKDRWVKVIEAKQGWFTVEWRTWRGLRRVKVVRKVRTTEVF